MRRLKQFDYDGTYEYLEELKGKIILTIEETTGAQWLYVEIKDFVEKYYSLYLNKEDSFKIELKRRKNEIIERDAIIESVAKIITNKVDLDNPDKIIKIELLGNVSGISFLNHDDIFVINNKYNKF